MAGKTSKTIQEDIFFNALEKANNVEEIDKTVAAEPFSFKKTTPSEIIKEKKEAENNEEDKEKKEAVKKEKKKSEEKSTDLLFEGLETERGKTISLYLDADVLDEMEKRMKAAGIMGKRQRSKVINMLLRRALGMDQK